MTYDAIMKTMGTDLSSLSWYWTWDKSQSAGIGFSTGNVWSRQARRKMKLAGQESSASKLSEIPVDPELGVRIQSKIVSTKDSEERAVEVVISWIQGTDSVLFESFCGMLKRKLEGK